MQNTFPVDPQVILAHKLLIATGKRPQLVLDDEKMTISVIPDNNLSLAAPSFEEQEAAVNWIADHAQGKRSLPVDALDHTDVIK